MPTGTNISSKAAWSGLRYSNLVLLFLFPVSWFAPLANAGLLPYFLRSDISVLTGIASLYESDIFLAVVVAFFALIAPIGKTIILSLMHFNRIGPRWLPLLGILGKLAMADVFLIALYIILSRGAGLGRLETAWGLYLFSLCIIVSLLIGWITDKPAQNSDIVDHTETNTPR